MLRVISEAAPLTRRTADQIFGVLAERLRDFETVLNRLQPKEIGKILKIYCEDQGYNYGEIFNNLENLDVEEFVDWFDMSGSTGNFIFDFGKSTNGKLPLPVETIIELAQYDKRLEKAIRKLAVKRKLITPDNKEYTSDGEGGKPVDFRTICRWIFIDMNSVRKPTDKEYDETDLMSYPDLDMIDPDYYDETIDDLQRIYNRVSESINEADEEEVEAEVDMEVEPIPVDEDEPEVEETVEVEYDEEEQKEFDDNSLRTAIKDLVNQLMTDTWALISKINSGITTIDYDFKDDERDALLDILNGAADDATIIVGMLSKASSILDNKALELMLKGEEKADKLINK